MGEITILNTNSSENKPIDIQFQKRLSKNLISNIIYFIINIIVGLALVPFFLNSLGEAAYAMVPLATSVTSYTTLIISCLNGIVIRYLTLDLQRGDRQNANITYNTAIFGTLAVVLILLPIGFGFALATPYIFSVGGEEHINVVLLFILVILAAFIKTWASNFQVPLFAYNRLDLSNIVESSYLLIEVIFIIIAFFIFGPSLPLIGLSYVIAAVSSRILAGYFSHNLSPFLKLNIHLFNKPLLIEMGKTAGWFLVQQFGSLLMLPVCLIIVNILFGAVAETEFSIAQTFFTLIISIAALISNLFRPQIYAYISQYNYNGVASFLVLTTKITGYIMALPIVLVCLLSPQILTIWVGSEYVKIVPLVCLLTLPSIINVQNACIGPLNFACNKIKATAIAGVITGIINVILGFSLPIVLNIGSYGVIIALIIALILNNLIFVPIYSAYIIHAPLMIFVKPMILGIISVVLLFIIGELILQLSLFNTLSSGIIFGFIFSLGYGIFLLKIILKKKEKDLIRSCLPHFISKIVPTWLL